MTYFGSWYGGPNYRSDGTREVFDSIDDAKQELQRRLDGEAILRTTDGNGNEIPGTQREGSRDWLATPCVDETSDLYLYAADSAQYETSGHDYPTYRVFFGPRGGVRHERA